MWLTLAKFLASSLENVECVLPNKSKENPKKFKAELKGTIPNRILEESNSTH